MAYLGLTVPIPMGRGGLHTDDSANTIPPTSYILANNVVVHSNLIEKEGGSARLNSAVIPSGVMGAFDWWPTSSVADRKLVCVGGDGRVYFVDNSGAVTEVTASGAAPATLTASNQVYMLTGGQESGTASKKLFIITGSNPVQVITGTASVRTNLASPPSDWALYGYPNFALIHRNRLWFTAKHTIYGSDTANHENFATNTLVFPIFPGEAEKLNGAVLYKGRMFLFKTPAGAYFLDDEDPNLANWAIRKISSSFGMASPHSAVEALNDLLIKNTTDSISSVAAVQEFGDIEAGDTLSILRIEQFMRENTDSDGMTETHGIYYPEKKTVYFTYRGLTSSVNNTLLKFRVSTNEPPKATLSSKDAVNCLALRRDDNGIERPVYGSLDGYVYNLDQDARNVNNLAYAGEFQTPHMDFGFTDTKIAGRNKHFDFLEMRYISEGPWIVYVDVYIDGNFYETIQFPMDGSDVLADDTDGSEDFMLAETDDDTDGSFLSSDDINTLRKRLNGTGRTISFKIYNTGLNETFKIATLLVGFRPSGEQQR